MEKIHAQGFAQVPSPHRGRIVEAVGNLAENPFPDGVEKLSGSQHAYRIRLGDYRVVYEVVSEMKLIEVQRVRHRKDVYKT